MRYFCKNNKWSLYSWNYHKKGFEIYYLTENFTLKRCVIKEPRYLRYVKKYNLINDKIFYNDFFLTKYICLSHFFYLILHHNKNKCTS